jgi:hypothetical protein
MSSNKRRKMLCLVRPKACQRCGGDLSLECDIYGVYAECIQCGATWSKKDLKLNATSNAPKASKPGTVKPEIVPDNKR